MKHFVVSEDELVELFHKSQPKSERAWGEMQRIRKLIMQKCIPDDAIGFVHPSRTPDGKYTISFFPNDWKK